MIDYRMSQVKHSYGSGGYLKYLGWFLMKFCVQCTPNYVSIVSNHM